MRVRTRPPLLTYLLNFECCRQGIQVWVPLSGTRKPL